MGASTPLTCELCGTPKSTRKGRRFCSIECRHAWDARPEPAKVCAICGTTFERATYASGVQEARGTFSRRQVCPEDSCKAALMRRKAFELNPHQPGRRTVLARSCDECGDLFVPSGSHWTCPACRWARVPRAALRRYQTRVLARYHELQEGSLPAPRHGYLWTGPELELLSTRTDLTREELAALLGRSYAGVQMARKRLNEPKWKQVAGVDA